MATREKMKREWVEKWIDGMSDFIAESPNEELPEFLKEKKIVAQILREKDEELLQKAENWLRGMGRFIQEKSSQKLNEVK